MLLSSGPVFVCMERLQKTLPYARPGETVAAERPPLSCLQPSHFQKLLFSSSKVRQNLTSNKRRTKILSDRFPVTDSLVLRNFQVAHRPHWTSIESREWRTRDNLVSMWLLHRGISIGLQYRAISMVSQALSYFPQVHFGALSQSLSQSLCQVSATSCPTKHSA